MKIILARVSLIAALLALFMTLPACVVAQAYANSHLDFFDVSITPASGTIVYTDADPNARDPRWTASALAEALNSLGEHDVHPDPDPNSNEPTEVKGGSITYFANVKYANAKGTADALSLTGSALSDVHVNDCGYWASATGRGQIFNSFIIEGGIGPVDVTFSVHLIGELHAYTGPCGDEAITEAIFGWELGGFDSTGDPIATPIRFFYKPNAVFGPNQPDKPIFVDELLSITLPLSFTDGTINTAYGTLLETDSESYGITVVPEPSSIIAMVVGLGLLAHMGWRASRRRARLNVARRGSLILTLALLAAGVPSLASYDGRQPRTYCGNCEACKNGGPSTPSVASKPYCPLRISLTRGNLFSTSPIASVGTGSGANVRFSLSYNSYSADGSKALVNMGLGYGWTHAYNRYLFLQRGHFFRADGNGAITEYPHIPGTVFPSTDNWFETLVDNGNGTYTVIDKDRTREIFGPVNNTPFLVGGPVLRLKSIVDKDGNVTTLFYSANGDLVEIRDTYGRGVLLGYVNHHLTSITDPLMRVTRLVYDSTGTKLLKVTDPALKSTQYAYNTLNQIIQVTDRDGRVFTATYNALRKPVGVKDAAGKVLFSLTNTTNWATDPLALARDLARVYVPSTTFMTDGRGKVWTYDYDKNGYVTRMVAPDGATTRYEYDPATLQVKTLIDAKLAPNTGVTRYEYDAVGNLVKMTDALLHVTTYTYDPVFNQMTSMMDPNLRKTTWDIDPTNGNVRSETDPLHQTRFWTYETHGNVETFKNKRGYVTMYHYDAFGNLDTITDPVTLAGNSVTRMTYDAVGNMLTRTDANTHTTKYAYDALDHRITVIDPRLFVSRTFYDNEGDVTKVVDANSHETLNAYDQRRTLVTITDARLKNTKFAYDDNDNRVCVTDRNTHTTVYSYDVQNRVEKITDALVEITRMTYDEVGNKLTVTDPNNHTTVYTYDPLNRVSTKTEPILASNGLAAITHFGYDMPNLPGAPECSGPMLGSSLVYKQTDAEGKVTYFGYDGLDRTTRVVRKIGPTTFGIAPTDALTTYTYDPENNRLSVAIRKDAISDLTTNFGYDELNRRTRETNPALDVTQYRHDPVGNVIRIIAPNGNVTDNSYDEKNELTYVSDSVGPVAGAGPVPGHTYDKVGNRLTDTDGNGNTTTYDYDELNRVHSVTDALFMPTLYGYDNEGNLTKVTDRNLHVTTHAYDDVNRRIKTTDGLGNQIGADHTTFYEYDFAGNLSRLTDANVHAIVYDYDGINRVTAEGYSDGGVRELSYSGVSEPLTRTDQNGQITQYRYDDLHRLIHRSSMPGVDDFTYDLASRMLTANRNGWPLTFQYDGANRVTKTTQNARPIAYAYDIPGRTRTITYPGGRVVTEHTDLRARIDTIGDAASTTPIAEYAYDPGNRVTGRAYRNGAVAGYSYDVDNRVLMLDHAVGAHRIIGFTYDYDHEGNKRFEKKFVGTLGTLVPLNTSEAYAYDAIDRLVDYKVGPPGGAATSWTLYDLDAVGNWNHKIKNGVTETRAHNAVNEITGIQINFGPVMPLSYDQNGNLTRDTRFDYRYDEENRLSHVDDNTAPIPAGVADYRYDALGRRVSKRTLLGIPKETRYLYDGARIIEEQNAIGATQATYVYGNYIDEVITMDRASQTYYYHQNALFSVHALTDSTGKTVEGYQYDAYGCQTLITPGSNGVVDFGGDDAFNPGGSSPLGNPYLFTGRQLDDESNLYYYRARYYDSVKGRFLQRDPIEPKRRRNLYEYVTSRPTFLVDPMGLEHKRLELESPASITAYCGDSITETVSFTLGVSVGFTKDLINSFIASAALGFNASGTISVSVNVSLPACTGGPCDGEVTKRPMIVLECDETPIMGRVWVGNIAAGEFGLVTAFGTPEEQAAEWDEEITGYSYSNFSLNVTTKIISRKGSCCEPVSPARPVLPPTTPTQGAHGP
jgi:RHS repeat-associated protein